MFGITLFTAVLFDAFHTVVLPRRVSGIFRLTNLFYRLTWAPFAAIARRIKSGRQREEYLSVYGPLSLLTLMACWAAGLILGFALMQWSFHLTVRGMPSDFPTALYVSASSLFTVAALQPNNIISRWLMTFESGLGLSFLGLVVGYLPVLYQSYASRELRISLLDARAGSPPTAGELLVRQGHSTDRLEKQFAEWEEWTAELLEEQLSYPMLAYFRSQHQNQSWLAALTAMLDASAIVSLSSEHDLQHQAKVSFAIGRHALVDLATVFRAAPEAPAENRLPGDQLRELRKSLDAAQTCLNVNGITEDELSRLRAMYEPNANVLSLHFLTALPSWLPTGGWSDNWLVTSWERSTPPFAVSDPFQEEAHK